MKNSIPFIAIIIFTGLFSCNTRESAMLSYLTHDEVVNEFKVGQKRWISSIGLVKSLIDTGPIDITDYAGRVVGQEHWIDEQVFVDAENRVPAEGDLSVADYDFGLKAGAGVRYRLFEFILTYNNVFVYGERIHWAGLALGACY